MKKTIKLVILAIAMYGLGDVETKADPLVTEGPIRSAGTGTSISLSTSAWTAVPVASSLNGRVCVSINNPSSNSYSIVGILHTSAPGEALTVYAREIQPGENPCIKSANKMIIYLHSLTATQTIHAQEYGN